MSAGVHVTVQSSKFTPATLIGVTEESTFPVPQDESRRQIRQKLERGHIAHLLASTSPVGIFCYNNPVVARLQQGPTFVFARNIAFEGRYLAVNFTLTFAPRL